jgi:hypothetical protein
MSANETPLIFSPYRFSAFQQLVPPFRRLSLRFSSCNFSIRSGFILNPVPSGHPVRRIEDRRQETGDRRQETQRQGRNSAAVRRMHSETTAQEPPKRPPLVPSFLIPSYSASPPSTTPKAFRIRTQKQGGAILRSALSMNSHWKAPMLTPGLAHRAKTDDRRTLPATAKYLSNACTDMNLIQDGITNACDEARQRHLPSLAVRCWPLEQS